MERCPQCGYERRGLEPGRRCPECGGPPPSAVDLHAPLDRFDHATIDAAIRWQGATLLVQLLGAFVVLAVLAGPGAGAWRLAAAGVAAGLACWIRTGRRLRPPGRPPSAAAGLVRRLGPIAAVLIVAIFGAGGGTAGATAMALAAVGGGALWLLASVAAREGASLASWSREDRAAGIADLAVAAVVLTVTLVVVLQVGRGIGGLTSVPVLDPEGLGAASGMVMRLGVLCWWVLQTLSDAILLASVVRCRLHRMEHDAADERRFERASQWNDEIAARFDDHTADDA